MCSLVGTQLSADATSQVFRFILHWYRRARPCPRCSEEKGDSTPRKLFFICGTATSEYHEEVPEEYFQAPPVKLSSNEEGFEVLRVNL